MAVVFTANVVDTLKLTLNEICDDSLTNFKEKSIFGDWLDVGNMDDNFVDDLETAGPGIAAEKPEGAEIIKGTIREGTLTRYMSRTFGLGLIITEEAIEDCKYKEVFRAGARLGRAVYKSIDIDTTNMLARATNTAYTFGDGQPLASATHTLPNGGTFSNLLTPISPSRIAMATARTQMQIAAGHDGLPEGYEPKAIVCPYGQWYIWKGLIESEKAPDPGSFNEINVVKEMNLKLVPNRYWSNTTTNWAVISDADNGMKFLWRRKPTNKTWVDNAQGLMNYGMTARWSRGMTDPRGVFFNNA